MKRSPLVSVLLMPVIVAIAKVFFRMQVENRHVIPQGGVIIAPNHISNWDPPFVAAAVRRPVYFMAKSEMFRNRVAAWFFYSLGAFPVYRRSSVNTNALSTAIDVVKSGNGVVIFPEGTRSRGGKVLPAKPGVGYIANASGAPVVPLYISGTDDPLGAFLFRNRFRFFFGEPISPQKLKEIHTDGGPKASATYILNRIKELKIKHERNDR